MFVKVLNSAELQNVSGGDLAGGLFLLTIANIGLGLYNAAQNRKLEERMDMIMFMQTYQEAQLVKLPHYSEIRNLNLQQVVNIAFS